jgi:hypothetical protein
MRARLISQSRNLCAEFGWRLFKQAPLITLAG